MLWVKMSFSWMGLHLWFYFQDTVVHCITCFVVMYYQLSDDGFGNSKVGGVLHLLITPAPYPVLFIIIILLLFFLLFKFHGNSLYTFFFHHHNFSYHLWASNFFTQCCQTQLFVIVTLLTSFSLIFICIFGAFPIINSDILLMFNININI